MQSENNSVAADYGPRRITHGAHVNYICHQIQDHTLSGVKTKGGNYLAIKPLRDAIRIDWRSHLAGLKKDSRFHLVSTQLVVESQISRMICLAIHEVPGWLDAIRLEKDAQGTGIDHLRYYRENIHFILREMFGWEPFSFVEPNGFGSSKSYERLSSACPVMVMRR
jgi:hypothetical protein